MKSKKIRAASQSGCLATVLTLSLSGAAAQAQDVDNAIEEIVVSAKFKKSIASAIEQKRLADTQIEAIGLEDIGVLPAVSIADAIATLPGVAGARTDNGQISQLSVRGTTDLALGTLNGREQVTITSTRNVEYQMYPPNVMTSVQVYKTQRADLPEGGLSGLINMDTIKPLDFDESSVTVNAEFENYMLADDVEDVGGDDWGGRASLTYINPSSDSFGFALGAAYANELFGRISDVTPFDWNPFTAGFGAPADVDMDGVFGEEFVPTGFNLSATGGDETRTSLFGAMQWKSDSVDVNFDILASSIDADFNEHGVNFIGLTGASGSLVDPVVNVRDVEGALIDEYGAATITVPGTNASGFGSGGSSSYNQLTSSESNLLSTGLNITSGGDEWLFEGDLSYSTADFRNRIFAGTTHLAPTGGFGGPTFTITYDALGSMPSLSVAEDMLDSSIWVPRQFEELTFENDDSLAALRLDATRFLSDTGITQVSFGARYSDRKKEYERLSNRFTSAVVPDDPTQVLDDSFVQGTVKTDNGPEFIVWNVNQLRSRFSQMIPQADAALPPPLAENTLLAETGSVEEDTLSAYVQFDFDTSWGDTLVSGNFGVRYASTDLVAPGWTTPARETVPATPIRPTHDYSEVLPSFNIAFDIGESQKLRFGVARVMNRAPLDDLRSSESIFISGFGANGNAGNPQLDPTVADQYSLSYEVYPDIATSIVIAAFYNDLDTFIGTEFVTREVIDVGGNPVDVVFQVPGNGKGGYIRGAEFTLNSSFGFITPGLDPLGISFNYAYTDSNVLPVAPGGVGVALTGLSEDVANLALYWASNNFEARLGWDYRSEYIEPSVFGNFLTVDDTLLTSFRLSYDFSEDFRIGIYGRNIGDEVRRKYTLNIPARTEFNNAYRETYGLNLYYRF